MFGQLNKSELCCDLFRLNGAKQPFCYFGSKLTYKYISRAFALQHPGAFSVLTHTLKLHSQEWKYCRCKFQ